MTESLRRSETKFRTLFECSPDGVVLLDDNGFLDCNPAALELFGCSSPEQFLGRNPTDISPPLQPSGQSSVVLVKQRLAAVMASGLQRFEWLHRRLDTGACFPAEVLLSVMELDGREVIQAVVQDITERKRAEQDLLASQEMFFKVFHGAPLLVSLSRLEDGQYIESNDRYCRTMGYTRGEMLGHTSVELGILDAADRTRLIELVGQPGHARNVEFTLYSRERVAVHCLFSGEVVEVGGQNLLIAMLADITESRQAELERRRLQVEIEHMQKLESLGCLAGGVAHDMNNVLGAILGLASANLESLVEGSQTYRAFNTIAKAATRGGEMVKSLLAFARQSRVDMTNLDLNGLIRDEVHLLERTTLSRVKLVMDLAEPLAPIRGDSGTLTHAIMNLCVNAVDAMAEGGTLTLRSRNLGPERIEVQVQDTGSGMSTEVLAKAVEPFFTTKEIGKGTGLGLSLVYSTVKAHGGQMELRSEPGQGTCVSLRFPTQVPTRELAQSEALAERAQGALHIVVVDDDELVRSSLEVVLETLGHSTTMLTSGEAVLEFLEAGRAADAVILDLNMPGLGGRGTLPRLRALRPDLPVLLATGRADDAAQDLAATHANTWLLRKSFPIEVLRKHLVKWQSV